MAKDASFDIVSEIDMEDVKNALAVALKEITNRFDFKGSIADIKLDGDKLIVVAEDDFKLEQVKDVLFSKLMKHGVPIKNIQFSKSEHALGGNARQTGDLVSGIDSAWFVYSNGRVDYVSLNAKYAVRPVFYLNEDVYITNPEATGASTDPFILSY